METINKWTEHVVRDFLQERENRAAIVCDTILYGRTAFGGMRNRNYLAI